MGEMNLDKGYKCPACGGFVKRYTRTFNHNMAMCLLLLYKFNIRGWVKVEDFLIKNGQKRCGDFSYLILYGLLEKKIEKRSDGSKKNGYYKLTGRGIMFCENRLTVQKKFMLLHGEFQGFSGEEITIMEALGKAFNYDELMETLSPKTDTQKEKLKQLNLL